MATNHVTPRTRPDVSAARRELGGWYLDRLRPKLAQAARGDLVAPRAVISLDRQMLALAGLQSTAGASGHISPEPDGRKDIP